MILEAAIGADDVGAVCTTIWISSVEDIVPSLPVSRRTYVPEAEKVGVLLVEVGLLKVTVPEPLTLDQDTERVLPEGKPSSEAVPVRLAPDGSVIVWSGPAFTVG